MAIAPLIVRITAAGVAALGRAAAAMRAFGASVSSSARAAAGRAAPAFARLQAVLRAVASAAVRAAVAIGGPLRRALNAASRAARDLAGDLARFLLKWVGIIGALLPFIFALANVLANLLPLVTYLAPAAFAAGSALLVLKLGFQGVGDALSAGLSGDVEEFNKALKKLAPSARDFVKALVKIAPLWRDLQTLIQQKLFAGLAGQVDGVSTALGRLAATWLPKLAEQFNSFFLSIAQGLQTPEFARQIDEIMQGVSTFFFGALVAVRKLGRAFLDIATVAAKPFGELGANIGIAATKFADWVRKISTDGTLARWIQTAKDTFGQLLDIGREIGRVLGAIFKGTDEGGFLENLRNSISELADFLEGETGQSMIQFFSDIAKGAAGLIKTIGDVVRWFQDGIKIMKDILGTGKSEMSAAFGAIGAAASGLFAIISAGVNAFAWIGSIAGKLGGLVSAVRGAASAINAALGSIRTLVTIDIVTRYSTQGYLKPITSGGGGGGGSVKARASGGPVTRGMPYLVGEKRPEIFVPNQSGRILPKVGSTGGGGWSGPMTGLDALFYRWFNESVRAGKLRPV